MVRLERRGKNGAGDNSYIQSTDLVRKSNQTLYGSHKMANILEEEQQEWARQTALSNPYANTKDAQM